MRGSSSSVGRAELLRLIGQLRPIDRFESDRFVAGEPLRVLHRAGESDAQLMGEKLRALGAVVTVEPSPPEFSMPSDISLMSLDGEGDSDDLMEAPSLSLATPPPPMTAAMGGMPMKHDAFAAPPIEQTPMELVIAAPKAPPQQQQQQQQQQPHQSRGSQPVPFEPLDDEIGEDEDDGKPIPGKLLQGKLRQQPMVRLFAGLALGLGIGYLLSTPYADRADRRVAQVRAEANLDRYRPTDEAHANAARLDQQADDLASSAFMSTVVIWLGAAGAIMAGWYKLT